ncbi:hypothetical protein LIER_30087 [Lithospermum erythrorhizon]|uniref:Uncharacterized protein n=1 Tax=Lithospermum erythrorhizon TaxID=34254 RepID=A0AAV3RN54_LITER
MGHNEMEAPLLERQLIGRDGDYRAPKGLREWWLVFWIETVKLWKIGGPIAFNILCQFGTNSVTNIFVGHIGDLQLSAVSISLSVIGTFSFGFMVRLSLLPFTNVYACLGPLFPYYICL